MSVARMIEAFLQAGRRRRIATVFWLALPWLLASLALAWRLDSNAAAALPVLVLLLTSAWAWRDAQGIDERWLARRLDALRGDFEDSAGLLFAEAGTLPSLALLQRARLQQRLPRVPASELRQPWPLRRLRINTVLAGSAIIAILLWPAATPSPASSHVAAGVDGAVAAANTRISRLRLAIQPPAYTGLPARSEDALQVRVPEASTLRWTLRFDPQPGAAELVFHDGTRLPMRREGEDWTASRIIGKSTLYRLQLQAAPPLVKQGLLRIDVQPDRPPQLRVIVPDRSLSLLEDGQKQWPLSFEASDDYGLGAAQLHITLAQGSGENISVSERILALSGQGDRRRRIYRQQLDLASFGFAAGDDLIVRLVVNDNRAPQPQSARSASYILRWPPPASAEASGLEGMVKKVLPAYFRSQRQIIIDSEALLQQRRKLARDDYVSRSDVIGVDQRILRLRYGQFLGEEVDEGPKPPPKDGDQHSDDDGHDHAGAAAAPAATGDATSVLEAYGHTHDEAEAATLLDPETRALLKQALDQMWQAELHLRQGYPDRALPYEYRALGFIKQVQQASRIYLARVGLELPPIDETRRLSGDRKGLQSRPDPLAGAKTEASVPDALWRKLDPASPGMGADELDAFENWLRAHEADVPDALALYAATDALRGQTDCASCAARLRALLWPLLDKPATRTRSREEADRAGRAYLDALRQEDRP